MFDHFVNEAAHSVVTLRLVRWQRVNRRRNALCLFSRASGEFLSTSSTCQRSPLKNSVLEMGRMFIWRLWQVSFLSWNHEMATEWTRSYRMTAMSWYGNLLELADVKKFEMSFNCNTWKFVISIDGRSANMLLVSVISEQIILKDAILVQSCISICALSTQPNVIFSPKSQQFCVWSSSEHLDCIAIQQLCCRCVFF